MKHQKAIIGLILASFVLVCSPIPSLITHCSGEVADQFDLPWEETEEGESKYETESKLKECETVFLSGDQQTLVALAAVHASDLASEQQPTPESAYWKADGARAPPMALLG